MSVSDSTSMVEVQVMPHAWSLTYYVHVSKEWYYDVQQPCQSFLDFYIEDKVVTALNVIDSLDVCFPKWRHITDKVRLIVEDIVRHLLNPTSKLPEFHAVNLDRLPPVEATHCDVSAMLLMLQELCAEVRQDSKIKVEIEDMKSQISSLSYLHGKVADMHKNLSMCMSSHNETVPPSSKPFANDSQGSSAAQIVKKAVWSGALKTVVFRTMSKVAAKLLSEIIWNLFQHTGVISRFTCVDWNGAHSTMFNVLTIWMVLSKGESQSWFYSAFILTIYLLDWLNRLSVVTRAVVLSVLWLTPLCRRHRFDSPQRHYYA